MMSKRYDLKDVCLARVKYFDEDLTVINIVNSSVSKGNAISGLCRYLKINIEDSVAFGDDLNDMSMFRIANESYAVANADEELKKIATGIIESNENDGVAKWLANNVKI